MNWYVLQVMTGSEEQVQRELQKLGVSSRVPAENRLIRSGGQWITRKYLLFPSYVFLRMDYTSELFHTLSGINSVIRLLSDGSGNPSPLAGKEAAWIGWMTENLLTPSVVLFAEDGRCHPVSGALVPLASLITHISRHHRRATVVFSLAGKPIRLELSFIPKEL